MDDGRPDFSCRATTPERMDTDCAGYDDYATCLADLARVNAWTLTHGPTLRFLGSLVSPGRTLRILDVACGQGDALRRIDRWAARRGIAVELIGLDLNPWAGRAAVAATPPGRPIRWVIGDVFDFVPNPPVDVVVCSQFTHHLDDVELVRFLRWIEATAQRGWLIADLQRHWLPYHVFRWWSRAAGWHRFVQYDGAVSITRAFVKSEWRAALAAAGLSAVTLRWHMPFRLTMTRIKP